MDLCNKHWKQRPMLLISDFISDTGALFIQFPHGKIIEKARTNSNRSIKQQHLITHVVEMLHFLDSIYVWLYFSTDLCFRCPSPLKILMSTKMYTQSKKQYKRKSCGQKPILLYILYPFCRWSDYWSWSYWLYCYQYCTTKHIPKALSINDGPCASFFCFSSLSDSCRGWRGLHRPSRRAWNCRQPVSNLNMLISEVHVKLTLVDLVCLRHFILCTGHQACFN